MSPLLDHTGAVRRYFSSCRYGKSFCLDYGTCVRLRKLQSQIFGAFTPPVSLLLSLSSTEQIVLEYVLGIALEWGVVKNQGRILPSEGAQDSHNLLQACLSWLMDSAPINWAVAPKLSIFLQLLPSFWTKPHTLQERHSSFFQVRFLGCEMKGDFRDTATPAHVGRSWGYMAPSLLSRSLSFRAHSWKYNSVNSVIPLPVFSLPCYSWFIYPAIIKWVSSRDWANWSSAEMCWGLPIPWLVMRMGIPTLLTGMGWVHPCIHEIRAIPEQSNGQSWETFTGRVCTCMDWFYHRSYLGTSSGWEKCCKRMGQTFLITEHCRALQCHEELGFITNFFSVLDTYF